jgi:beta-phosphoglucomutase-like phosphatase (HAD superfamily)
VLLELEGLVLDTLGTRTAALHDALAAEGVTVAYEEVLRAHAGTSAARALDLLAPARTLDATGRMLVLRRADDAARRAFTTAPPVAVAGAADALERLAATHRVGVVTAAERELADEWLEATQLVALVRVLRSTHDLDRDARIDTWRDAARRVRLGLDASAPVLAVVPGADADDARAAGLHAVRARHDAALARLSDDVLEAILAACDPAAPAHPSHVPHATHPPHPHDA